MELGAKLFQFGGIATVVVVALVGLTRGEREWGRGFLAGAVSAWALTWIGSLLQTASLREGTIPEGLTLEAGFWLQAVGIGVTVIGTILVTTRRTGSHGRDAAGLRSASLHGKPASNGVAYVRGQSIEEVGSDVRWRRCGWCGGRLAREPAWNGVDLAAPLIGVELDPTRPGTATSSTARPDSVGRTSRVLRPAIAHDERGVRKVEGSIPGA